jgi:hypothetical protein
MAAKSNEIRQAKSLQGLFRAMLPNRLRHFLIGLPHSYVLKTKSLASIRNWTYKKVDSEVEIKRFHPSEVDPKMLPVYDQFCPRGQLQPETFSIVIPNGFTFSKRGYVFSEDGILLGDLTNQPDLSNFNGHPIFTKEILACNRLHLKGRVALLSTIGCDIYYHALIDMIPRIRLLEESGFSLNEFDSFIIPKNIPNAIVSILDKLGINGSRLKKVSRNTLVQAEELVVPSLAHLRMRPRPQSIRFLRESILPRILGDSAKKTDSGNKRIYIKRAGRRSLLNECEIQKILNKFSFKVISPESMSFEEQVSTFMNAEVILGLHGAGLANAAFTKGDAKILEIAPLDFPRFCYFDLALSAGHSLTRIPAKGIQPYGISKKRKTSRTSMLVNPDDLDRYLSQHISL